MISFPTYIENVEESLCMIGYHTCNGPTATLGVPIVSHTVEVYPQDPEECDLHYEFVVVQRMGKIESLIFIYDLPSLNQFLASVAPIIQCAIASDKIMLQLDSFVQVKTPNEGKEEPGSIEEDS